MAAAGFDEQDRGTRVRFSSDDQVKDFLQYFDRWN